MENGVYTVGFYELTPTEINDLVTAEIRRREEDMRSRAVFAWHTAYLTGIAARAPRSFPRSPAEHFGWLDTEPAWVRSKREMARFAARHNAKRRDNA